MRKVVMVFLILILTGCGSTSYIALQDAERGMFLDRASKTSVNTFFDRRMESELESSLSKDWYIVNEDLDYVYYGRLIKKNGFTMINPFYKVDRKKLLEKFPGFRSLEGKHIKAKVFQSYVKPLLEERLIPLCSQSYNVQYGKRDYKLTDKGIESNIQLIGRCYEEKIFKSNIEVLLEPANLEQIEAITETK